MVFETMKTHPFLRLRSILKKEFIHIKRDLLTYTLFIITPFIQFVLFGYIINTDPRHLPTVVRDQDNSVFSRNIINDLKNTGYFKIIGTTQSENAADKLMKSGDVFFVLTIPSDFSKDLVLEKQPQILLEADGSDPISIINAINAAKTVSQNYRDNYFVGPLNFLRNNQVPFQLNVQVKYNPGLITQYHSLPGLIVVILSITLPIITALSLTREYVHGTMESLLTTPVKPSDIILGKIIPLIFLGYIIFILVLLMSYYLFRVPFHGNVFVYLLLAFPFFLANLGVGLMAALLSNNELRAATVTNEYVLPATLLSGFLFPFYGMPYWAQVIGNIFPPAHFLRITTNFMLKDASFIDVWPDVWPILLFVAVTFFISIRYYRLTLD